MPHCMCKSWITSFQPVVILPPGGTSDSLQIFLLSQLWWSWGMVCATICLVHKAWDSIRHSTRLTTAFHKKELCSPECQQCWGFRSLALDKEKSWIFLFWNSMLFLIASGLGPHPITCTYWWECKLVSLSQNAIW